MAGETLRAKPSAGDPTSALTRVLVRALRALGESGHPVRASRLAAAAWSAIRHEHPGDAERLNGLLHYLARLPAESDTASDEAKETPTTIEDRRLDVHTEASANGRPPQ